MKTRQGIFEEELRELANRLNLTTGERLLLFVLNSYMEQDSSQECTASLSTLANDCRCYEMTVKRSIDKLCALGVISKEARTRQDGGKTTNSLRFRYSKETGWEGCKSFTGGDYEDDGPE